MDSDPQPKSDPMQIFCVTVFAYVPRGTFRGIVPRGTFDGVGPPEIMSYRCRRRMERTSGRDLRRWAQMAEPNVLALAVFRHFLK